MAKNGSYTETIDDEINFSCNKIIFVTKNSIQKKTQHTQNQY